MRMTITFLLQDKPCFDVLTRDTSYGILLLSQFRDSPVSKISEAGAACSTPVSSIMVRYEFMATEQSFVTSCAEVRSASEGLLRRGLGGLLPVKIQWSHWGFKFRPQHAWSPKNEAPHNHNYHKKEIAHHLTEVAKADSPPCMGWFKGNSRLESMIEIKGCSCHPHSNVG